MQRDHHKIVDDENDRQAKRKRKAEEVKDAKARQTLEKFAK